MRRRFALFVRASSASSTSCRNHLRPRFVSATFPFATPRGSSTSNGHGKMNMDKPELTAENLKAILVEEYARAVVARGSCEQRFRVLNPDDIDIMISEEELVVKFPCLPVMSTSYWCAQTAAKETGRRFFGEQSCLNNDWFHASSGIPESEFDLESAESVFEWRHRF